MEILKTYSVTDDTLKGELNSKKLQNEINEANCVVNLKSIDVLGDTFTVVGASISDESVLNNTIALHESINLDEKKSIRYVEIDNNTVTLILQGFTYKNLVFSLSQNAQINILGLDNTRFDSAITYPIGYSTKDDSGHYDVVDATDLHNMYLTALATKKAWVDSGTALKDAVRAATNEAEVQAIIDNR